MKKALKYLMFLKEKSAGSIKPGDVQRGGLNKNIIKKKLQVHPPYLLRQ